MARLPGNSIESVLNPGIRREIQAFSLPPTKPFITLNNNLRTRNSYTHEQKEAGVYTVKADTGLQTLKTHCWAFSKVPPERSVVSWLPGMRHINSDADDFQKL